MVNTFLSKKLIIPAVILFGGLLIFSAILFFPNFFGVEPTTANQNPQWTQETGAGISVPACGSASPTTPVLGCSGTSPSATFDWFKTTIHPDNPVNLKITLADGITTIFDESIPTSYTWVAPNIGTYWWQIYSVPVGDTYGGGNFTTRSDCVPIPSATPPPLYSSCSVFPTSATTGEPVTWTDFTSGGNATTLVQEWGTPNTNAGWTAPAPDNSLLARRFRASSSYNLGKAALHLAKAAGTVGNIWVTIEADASGFPSGVALSGGTSQSVNVASVCTWGACGTWIDFNVAGVQLTTGTNYWIVLHGAFSGGRHSILPWARRTDSDPGAKNLVRSFTNPSVWTDNSSYSANYRTYSLNYTYLWSGDAPLAGQTGNPVNISYPTAGTKTGSNTVSDGTSSTGPWACANAVDVSAPLPGDFTLSPPSFTCNTVSLSWTASTGADAYRILRGSPRVDISPYQPYTALSFTDTTVSQDTSYLYQIEAYNIAGTNRSNTRTVTTPYCPPTLNFSGDPSTVFEGQSSILTWSSIFTTSCTASGAWSGPKAVSDSEVVIPLPPPSVTYNLQCSGLGGSTPVTPVVINVTPLGLPEWKEIIPR